MFGMRHRVVLACALALLALVAGAGTAVADVAMGGAGSWADPRVDLPDPVGSWLLLVIDLLFDIV